MLKVCTPGEFPGEWVPKMVVGPPIVPVPATLELMGLEECCRRADSPDTETAGVSSDNTAPT